jgi:hypothetical protein
LTKIDNTHWYFVMSQVDSLTTVDNGFCIRNSSSGGDDSNETQWVSWNSWSTQSFNTLRMDGTQVSSDHDRFKINWETLNEVSSAQGGAGNYISSTSPAYNTQRIWCHPTASWWTGNSARTGIRYGDGTTDYIAICTSFTNTLDNVVYYYADIPLDTSSSGFYYQFVRLNNGIDGIYNYSANGTASTNNLIHYINDNSGANATVSTGIAQNAPSSALAQYILEGYTTCVSTQNGYPAYQDLKTNYIDNLSASEVALFNADPITDYSGESFGGDYSTLTRNTVVTCGEKFEKMGSLYTSHNGAAIVKESNSDSSATVVLGGLAVVAVLAAGAYFFIRKKKTD